MDLGQEVASRNGPLSRGDLQEWACSLEGGQESQEARLLDGSSRPGPWVEARGQLDPDPLLSDTRSLG